jgi:geranylgeranyl diphosphate synthase, type II
MGAESFLAEKAAKTEAALLAILRDLGTIPESLRAAMEYSLMAGGKRLRPALALGAADLVAGDDAVALPVACGLEMIHTYSLIHDDLPSMDNDDLRRGKPTLHKAHGEALAILAGDALLTLAFDVIAQTGDVRVVSEIARAAGAQGMAGGQVMDLESEDKQLTLGELRKLHEAKTGALICVSVRAGAILAGADADLLEALTQYGDHIGLAFQIADDILDVVGAEEALGKPVGSDEGNQKATYPAVVGLDRSRLLAQEAAASAVGALEGFGPEADIFRDLAQFIVERDK